MATKKSAFLSSFGVSMNVFKAITDAVLAEGGSDDDLRALISDPDKCRRIALEIVGRKAAVPAPPETYLRVPVAYKLPPMAELERKYSGEGSVSMLFDGRPWERHSSCETIDETPGERMMRLAEVPEQFIDRKIKDCRDELAAHFDKLGERFAVETEAHDFACKEPDAQRKNWILALGSSALRDNDDRCVAVLREFVRDRILDDHWIEDELNRDGRLLLVSK
jgi:hypothetical protein